MGHLAFTKEGKVRQGTPDAWLPVAAQIARFARKLSGRGDIVANVGPGVGGQYATACWSHYLADLDVNTETCLPGYTPDRVNFEDPVFRLGALPFVGAVTHEAAHAAWTAWTPYDLGLRAKAGSEPWNRATIEIVVALEESRIERLAVMKHPENRDALAQCALSIVLRDFKVNNTLYGASLSLALTAGRYPILSVDEIDRFRSLVEPHLPLGLMARLEALIREYHAMPIRMAKGGDPMTDADYARMYDIASRWLIAIRETATELEAARKREEAREAARAERERAAAEAAAEDEDEDEPETDDTDDEPAEDVDSEDEPEDEDVPSEDDADEESEPTEDEAPEADDPAEPAPADEGDEDEDGEDEGASEPAETGDPSEDADDDAEAVEADDEYDEESEVAGAERPSEDMESGSAPEASTAGESGPESDDTDVVDYSDEDDDEGAPEPSEDVEDEDSDADSDEDSDEDENATEDGSDAGQDDLDLGNEEDTDEAPPTAAGREYDDESTGPGEPTGDLDDNSDIDHRYDEEGDEDYDVDLPDRDVRQPQPDLRSGIPGEDEEGQIVVVIVFDENEDAPEEPETDEGDSLADDIRSAAGEAAMDREADALDERAEQVAERKIADRAADGERHAMSAAAMAEQHGESSHGFSTFCDSHRMAARDPKPGERIAANRLAGMLERITFHDRAVKKVDRLVPGGKLRPRAAVAKAADRSRGGRAEIPVWRAKERRHTAETPVTIGIMTDVSGSMGGNVEPSAVLTYVLSQAVSQIDGKVATAVFGSRGYLVNRAYERTTKVQPWQARDGHEAFREGALLIDEELNLLDGEGARILVVFTDSELVNGPDAEYASTFMRLCKQKNVAVIWCSYHETPISNYGHGAVLDLSGSAADIANTLGAAILKEVSKVEASRGA